MAFDESPAARVGDALVSKKGVEEKMMFGGLGFLLNGNLLVGVRKDALLVRMGQRIWPCYGDWRCRC
jgi:TfoX/Sxy family transcriptional regulator of competence genes